MTASFVWPLAVGIAGIYALLAAASLTTWALSRRHPARDGTELARRVRSWWWLVTLIAIALIGPTELGIVFMAFVSYLALKEYISLIPTRRADRRVLLVAYLLVPVQFYLIATAQYGLFILTVPVYGFLLLPFAMLLTGVTKDFLLAAGTLHWGLMLAVFAIGHAAYLLVLPGAGGGHKEGAALLFILIVLTQGNDVAQYVWGKIFGRRKILPSISPGKTVAGFLGGLGTTVLVGALLLPVFSPLDGFLAVAAAFLIAFAGFVGDVTLSALKRDLGIKDTGSLIPGHGGIFDRIDSLAFTAPLFFHFVRYFAY